MRGKEHAALDTYSVCLNNSLKVTSLIKKNVIFEISIFSCVDFEFRQSIEKKR